MQSVLPLGASNLLSKSSEIWEQLCSEPAFSSLHFVSSASSSVDKRLSTDFTWQPAGSRARTGSPPRDQAKSLANPKALLPVAGQTQGSERGSPKVGRSSASSLTFKWWLRLKQGSCFESPSPLQCARPHMGFVGRARTDRCQGAAAEGTFTRTWVRGQSQKMLAGAWQARATSFHVWEWQGSPYGNYLANHFVVGAERVNDRDGRISQELAWSQTELMAAHPCQQRQPWSMTAEEGLSWDRSCTSNEGQSLSPLRDIAQRLPSSTIPD